MRQHAPGYLLKDLVSFRNKAEELRTSAVQSPEEIRRIYHRLAKAYEDCALMIEELTRATAKMDRD